MKGTANTSSGGRFCGRAVHGISNLSREDLHQIEAHRCRERPTPWAHLAVRYSVNEIDLRNFFQPKSDNASPMIEPAAQVMTKARGPQIGSGACPTRDKRFVAMWGEGATFASIRDMLGMSRSGAYQARVRLGLPPRHGGGRPSEWTAEQDQRLGQLWLGEGASASHIGRLIGKSRCSVIGRAYRLGLTRSAARPPERFAVDSEHNGNTASSRDRLAA